jgi:acyl-CoA thioesterase-1
MGRTLFAGDRGIPTSFGGSALLARAACLLLFVACSPIEDAPSPLPKAEPAPAVVAQGPRVLFLGDSISAGLHLPSNEAFPAVLGSLLAAEGLGIELVNAGVSGDTTAGGVARLDWLLRQKPDLFVLELGGNDGLRGVALESIESNLRTIVKRVQDQGIPLLLLGMKLPPSYGKPYTEGFEAIFTELAEQTKVSFIPFFMEGVAGDPEFNLPDGLHPTAEGHKLIAAKILPVLRELVIASSP